MLIADDEKVLADLYEKWLDDAYDTRVAYDDEEAIELIDDSIDVALLDRRMPGYSGDELVSTIRRRGIDCTIAIISANEPDLDVLGVEYDAYLTKPIREPDELNGLLETLNRRLEYGSDVQRLLALASRKTDIEICVSEQKLAESEEYTALVERIHALHPELPEASEALEEANFRTTFQTDVLER